MTVDEKLRWGQSGDLEEKPKAEANKLQLEILTTDPDFQREIVWKNVIGFIYLHVAALYGLYLAFTSTKLLTNIWAFFVLFGSSQGVLMGAHRLFSHKSYKASWQLRLILVVLQTVAGQNCMYVWVRDHRQHHKYSDTDADPHNARRGFFFSHMGWLMSRKHPKVIEKGKGINMDDLKADEIVMFQKKYYKTLYVLLAIAIPTLVPYYLWQEDILNSLFVAYFFRYIFQLHGTWCVNSVAHIFGNRPYDQDLVPVESSFTSIISMGEGWHNYHHAFPFDYRASEFSYRSDSITTQLIDLMERVGWATDLRTASTGVVQGRILRKGDGTHAEAPSEGAKRHFPIHVLHDLDKFTGLDTDESSDYIQLTSEHSNGAAKAKGLDGFTFRSKIVSHG